MGGCAEKGGTAVRDSEYLLIAYETNISALLTTICLRNACYRLLQLPAFLCILIYTPSISVIYCNSLSLSSSP